MSTENPVKKRCLVKHLDFENCVFTGFKSKLRRKKRLRARMTRDVNVRTPERTKEDVDVSLPPSPVLLQRIPLSGKRESSSVTTGRNIERSTSPVFECRRDSSPAICKPNVLSVVFRSKRMINFNEEGFGFARVASPLEKSPVFKFNTSKPGISKQLEGKEEENDLLNKPGSSIGFDSGGVITDEFEKSEENSVQIEDFTQDYESNVYISLVESQNLGSQTVRFSGCGSDSQGLKFEEEPSSPLNTSMLADHTIGQNNVNECQSDEIHVQLPSKIFIKNGMLHRLTTITSKQMSEQLLWRHRKRRTFCTEKLSVLDNWAVNARQVLKCSSLDAEAKIKYLIVDATWVPSVKKIRTGSSILLHPPWQMLCVGRPQELQFLLNILYVEVLDEAGEQHQRPQFKCVEVSPGSEDQEGSDVDLLYNSLFTSQVSPFLY